MDKSLKLLKRTAIPFILLLGIPIAAILMTSRPFSKPEVHPETAVAHRHLADDNPRIHETTGRPDIDHGPIAGSPPKVAANQPSSVSNRGDAIQSIPQDEQASLWNALSEVRHEFQDLTASEAAMDRNQGVRHFAYNPAQRLEARVFENRVRFESGLGESDWSADFTLSGCSPDARPAKSGSRVEFDHGKLSEWWDNRPEGYEHGFVLESPLAEGENQLISVQVEGLVASADPDNADSIILSDAMNTPRLAYRTIKAWDANHRPLAAHMKPSAAGIDLMVSTRSATYPIMIDPLLVSLETKLLPEITGDGQIADLFGYSVDVDGDTTVIGSNYSPTPAGIYSGRAYVFVRRRSGTWELQSNLTGADTNENDRFGFSVAIDGDTLVVGSYLDDPSGSNSGSAYVFARQGETWSQTRKLVPSDGSGNDNFGHSVAISAEDILVGSPKDAAAAGSNAGSVYVFNKTGGSWLEQTKLTASDATASAYFGRSVSIDGNTALVGAPLAATSSGSVYAFVRDGTAWSQQSKMVAADGSPGDQFGCSVSVDGDTVVIGARYDDDKGNDAGAAYVFVRSLNLWTQQAKLVASNGTGNSHFGASVDVEGDQLMVGASWSGPSSSRSGTAYAYGRNAGVWSQKQILTAADASSGSFFGTSVALSGGIAIVGATYDSDIGYNNSGAAYAFALSGGTWSQEFKFFVPGDGAVNDGFGCSVELDGDSAVIGASEDNTASGTDSGSAYVFQRTGKTWQIQARLLGSDTKGSDRFGSSVSLDGDTVVVGAWLATRSSGLNAGEAYVFTRSGNSWSQQAALHPVGTGDYEYFGTSTAVDGNIAVVGAYWDNTRRGSATVFVRTGETWSVQQKLSDADGGSEDNFGLTLSLSGQKLAVGALNDDDLGNGSGSVFVYTQGPGGWVLQSKLHAPDGKEFHHFGSGVSLSGETLLIGSTGGFGTIAGSGCVYSFARVGDQWNHEGKIFASDGANGDNFGDSISHVGDLAVIGSPRDAIGAYSTAGSAYVFSKSGGLWLQQNKLLANDGRASDFFGNDVSLSGNTILVAAEGDDGMTLSGLPAQDQGSVSVFSVATPGVPPTVTNPEIEAITQSSAGLGANISSDGGAGILSRGFVISETAKNPMPAIGGKDVTRIDVAGITGAFATTAMNLSGLTGYSVRSFAINSAGTAYSAAVVRFLTTACDLDLEIRVPSLIANQGETIPVEIVSSNQGPDAVRGAEITVFLPLAVEFVSAGAPGAWAIDSSTVAATGLIKFSTSVIAPGGTASLLVRVKIREKTPTGDPIVVQATATTPGTDQDMSNNTDSAQVLVGTLEPTSIRLTSRGVLNRKTGLYEISVKVRNTTPYALGGVRLNVDFSAYRNTHPDLHLYQKGAPVKGTKVELVREQQIPIDGSIVFKLRFYTKTRNFPNPFLPVLLAEGLPSVRSKLRSSLAGDCNEPGAQPQLERSKDGDVSLRFPSTPGAWYQVIYSDDLVHWKECPVLIQARENETRWLDQGPPFTQSPTATTPSRFYQVNAISTPGSGQ